MNLSQGTIFEGQLCSDLDKLQSVHVHIVRHPTTDIDHVFVDVVA